MHLSPPVALAMTQLLLIYCLMYLLFVGVLCLSLFCYVLFCVRSSLSNILKRRRKLVALLFLSYTFMVVVYVLWLFLTVPWDDLQCVIVVLPDHIYLLFQR